MSFPDVFVGGCYIIGCDFYRNVAVPGQVNQFWRASFSPPAGALMSQAKYQARHVMLTGETDANRPQTRANFEVMKREGFKNITYFEVPKDGARDADGRMVRKGARGAGTARIHDPPESISHLKTPASRSSRESVPRC